MTTSNLQELLALNPGEALVKMFNTANNTDYRLDGFTFSLPTVVSGIVTEVTLTGKTPTNAFEDQWTSGSVVLTYNRLNMATYLANVLSDYRPSLPLSTQNILDEITRLIGQTFYIDDMILEEVTRVNGALYRLKAKPESLRWVGYIDLPLITLTPINTLFNANILSAVTDASQVVYPPNVSMPLINASDYSAIVTTFRLGDRGQDRTDIVTVFNATVSDPSMVNPAASPWMVSTTPGPFNLYNATVQTPISGLGVNPAIPSLESAAVLSLDGAYCTNFASGTIVIPYTVKDFNIDGFVATPRLTQGSEISLSNGTNFNVFLNSLTPGMVFSESGAAGTVNVPANFVIDGTTPWVVHTGLPLPTNLANAVVTYNGVKRSTDLDPATQGLDRVLEVELALDNSVWEGLYRFYYAGVIRMPIRDFKSTMGSALYVDFTPTAGTGPFVFSISSGALPPGATLDATTGLLSGTPTTLGDYQYTLSITDAVGNVCTFPITQHVVEQIAALTMSGSLPNGVVGTPYVAFLDVQGGLAPYGQPTAIAGNLPPTIALTLTGSSIRVAGNWLVADTYYFSIGITSADNQSTSQSFKLPVAPDPNAPTVILRVTELSDTRVTEDSTERAIEPGTTLP